MRPTMARVPWDFLLFLFLVLIFDLVLCGGNLENFKGVIRSDHGSAMVLPLVFSSFNSSKRVVLGEQHRRLQTNEPLKSNAHMKLYDDLLTNGYYTTRIWIGTPPQEFALIVDSGSTVTYVPCSTCEQCGNHQDPKFQPDSSSTYQPVRCNLDCDCDREKDQCVYERQYAEMSSSSGVLGNDIVSFGNESALPPHRAVFGCENAETGDLYSQHADGIIGLGRGKLSIMDQLVEKGAITDSFSLCYGGMGFGGGGMVLGGIPPPPGMVFSHSDPLRSPYYNLELKEIHVAGKSLRLNPSVFNSKHGTVLDSGTTYAYLPEVAFLAFKDAMMKQIHSLRRIPGPDPSYHDVCFSGSGSEVSELSKTFPDVNMVFENGQMVTLAPENYLFRHSKVRGAYCLGVFQNGKDPTTLLGGIIVRNTLVTYDRGNERIGFWKTNCSELWERLQLASAPPPRPSPSVDKNSTMKSLAQPPLPDIYIPGHLQRVGLMEFEMTMTIKIQDLVPQSSKLAQSIAHELEIKYDQVQMLNFTSEGNGSLIRWAISPDGPNDYIPNTTAESILSRLNEGSVHLPDTFGTYKLVSWKVEPPPKRTWWHWQHFLVFLVVGVLAATLTFSVLVTWYIWRRHKQKALGSYKPVEIEIADQEIANEESLPLQDATKSTDNF